MKFDGKKFEYANLNVCFYYCFIEKIHECVYVTMYIIGFDLCKLGEQALQMSYFDASVAFFEFCIQRLKKDALHNKKILGIFRKDHLSSITLKNAEFLLEKAIVKHDHNLQSLGPIGIIHRCRSQPFRENSINASRLTNTDISLSSSNTSMWYYNTSTPRTTYAPLSLDAATRIDALCRGEKQKVSVYRHNLDEYNGQ